ncbi:hypothetical protein HanXRQr2_Chr08g0341911 [Helianthus annuus]|uniref:Secreted protein n=1 Tax=Helianthus annuus TaxID=4232 RepID=A0A9K3IFI3_HELAN|nr:hypothetical protein HanXRQr2_Chr08g0341911 [Helianthus annuus]
MLHLFAAAVVIIGPSFTIHGDGAAVVVSGSATPLHELSCTTAFFHGFAAEEAQALPDNEVDDADDDVVPLFTTAAP